MTNPTDTTNEPTGPDGIEAQLRATLQAAAPADTKVDAGLDDLRSRIDGGLALAPAGTDHGRRRLLLVAAAVVLVVAAVAGALLASGGDGGSDGTSLATDPPQQPTEPHLLTVPVTGTKPTALEATTTTAPATTTTALAVLDPVGADESGFYVPVGLPEGWSLRSVTLGIRYPDGAMIEPGHAPPADARQLVTVELQNPDGDFVAYGLSRPGDITRSYGATPTEYRAEGQVAALDRYVLDGPDGDVRYRFAGSWPNADVLLGEQTHVVEGADPDEDDLILLASLLRPVSTEDWRAFLATQPGGDPGNLSQLNALSQL